MLTIMICCPWGRGLVSVVWEARSEVKRYRISFFLRKGQRFPSPPHVLRLGRIVEVTK